ncbi:PucR family transcriptional regulator [Clostridium sp.]|nr:helix-turn-helix domain-containing protein [Clostridium sp.]MCI1717252.1 helix-turn-helix domain-containing protein [Clostridium sp.]MCI1801592.1 helix-turn-helix domain-containing protein [Clostridium sp.]MCI1815438.1 helix-turn-helix domain-containing protein [Clostridium sp.]MCI2202887.1 helix-turn-helix domain-containing protein [Clostridium sp.]
MMLIDIFKEFINIVRQNKKYIIGLLNQGGNVICCSKEEYIGYHFDIKDSNTQNMFYEIRVKNKDYGYIWVSGNDENLKMISTLLLDTLKTRLMYEINTRTLKQKVTKYDELIKYLINDKYFDLNHILDLINQLGIDKNKTRIAVYIVNNKGFNSEEIMHLKLKPDSKEMIYSLLDRNSLLLFKDIPNDLDNVKVKKYFQKYIRSLRDWGLQECSYLVGSMQNKLRRYIISYQNCLWLAKNIHSSIDKPVFFTNYLFKYFVSKIQLDNIRNIFDFYKDRIKGFDIDEFITIANQLFINDYNITQTADDLFFHKNTLIYKLKKYEKIFDINIRGSFQGKVLMILIASALKEYQRQKQVGE